jgi:hypothetical protein
MLPALPLRVRMHADRQIHPLTEQPQNRHQPVNRKPAEPRLPDTRKFTVGDACVGLGLTRR